MANEFTIRKGTAAQLGAITPVEAELIYTTDDFKVYVGDGSTLGGVLVTGEVANMAQNTIKGRISSGSGAPEDLTATQARNIVDRGAAATVNVTGNITLAVATHAGKTLVCDGAHTITITSATGFSVGQACVVRNEAATAVDVTVAQGSGATVTAPAAFASPITIPEYGVADIYCSASNVYRVNGMLNVA